MSDVTKPTEEIRVTINTIDGESWTSRQSENEKVKTLVDKALAHFQIVPSPGTTYQLLLAGRPLPQDQTLREAGVKDDSTLLLAKEAQVGRRVI